MSVQKLIYSVSLSIGAFLKSSLIFAQKYVHVSKQFVQTAQHNRLTAKACNLLKIFRSSLKVSAIRKKSPCVIVHKKDIQMLSNVYNITLHYTCIKLCNSLDDSYFTEMQKAALLMYATYPFKRTHLHIIVSGILIERDCFKMFELLRIWLISQHLAAHFSHCKAMIDNMVHNSGPYFI